jgi:WD40 repeat protein
VGANRATVYRARPDGTIEVVQTYADADVSVESPADVRCASRRPRRYAHLTAAPVTPFSPHPPPQETEEFYACQWSASLPEHVDRAGNDQQQPDGGGGGGATTTPQQAAAEEEQQPPEGRPLLLAAGRNGVVRVIDVLADSLVASLRGHGKDVHDVAVHPRHPNLALTASRDHSVRLWNLRTGVCVVVVAGVHAHTNEVISLVRALGRLVFCVRQTGPDHARSHPPPPSLPPLPLPPPKQQSWHPWDPYRFMSSGMDSCVKVWTLRGEPWAAVEASDRWRPGHRAFPAVPLRKPLLSASQVHGDYVDCVRWLGDLCLSKSVHGFIALWKPRYGPAMGGDDDKGGGAAIAARADDERRRRDQRQQQQRRQRICSSGGGGGGGGGSGGNNNEADEAAAAAAAQSSGGLAPTEVVPPPAPSVSGGPDEEAEGGGPPPKKAPAAGAKPNSSYGGGNAGAPSRGPPPPSSASCLYPPLDPPPVSSADVDGDQGGYSLARLFPIDTGHMWWVRFGLDGRGATLACGGAAGTVHVWDPMQPRHGGSAGGGGGGGGTTAPKSSVLRTTAPKGGAGAAAANHPPSVVRQAAVSLDGSTVVAGCEDGSVWRWGRAYAPGLLPGAEPVTALGVAWAAAATGTTGTGSGRGGGGGDGGGGRGEDDRMIE